MRSIRNVIRWLFGFSISILVIWAVTAFFTENFYPRVWMKELNRNVPKPGATFQNCSEARAQTEFGELGLPGTGKIAGPLISKILIWGDSFVEAFQVDEPKRMHRQLEQKITDDGSSNVQVIGVGRRFQSFADYIFQIPVYEPLITPCKLHVIHLHTLDDIYPDQDPDHRISLFLSKPEFKFERYDNEYREIEEPEVTSSLKEMVFQARTQFFLRTRKQLTGIARLDGLRFSPGTQAAKQKASAANAGSNRWSHYLAPEWVFRKAPVEAWEFAIDSLKKTTDVPFLIIYSPTTPTLSQGKVVLKNPEAELVNVFGDICRKKNVGFINLDNDFLQYYEETGEFPKGFQTSRPWEGHYNAEGHRIVAEAIYQWIKEDRNVIHSN